MPTYPLKCTEKSCGQSFEVIVSVEKYEKGITCICGAKAERNWSIIGHIGYEKNIGAYDLGLGEYIESTSHRNRLMKQKGVVALTGTRTVKEQLSTMKRNNKRELKQKQEASLTNLMRKELAKHKG